MEYGLAGGSGGGVCRSMPKRAHVSRTMLKSHSSTAAEFEVRGGATEDFNASEGGEN